MIKDIHIKNFKSIIDMKMTLKQGLNVLVGPNGSGKTNIINFFEFLKALASNDLINAVGSVGGVGSIFRKIGENKFSETMEFSIFGSRKTGSRSFIVYKYEACISIFEDSQTIAYKTQRIKIKKRTVETENEESLKNIWDFDLETKGDNTIVIHELSKPELFNNRFLYNESKSKKSFREVLLNGLRGFSFSDESLFFVSRVLGETFWPIRRDMLSIDYYNINPNSVKAPEDAAGEPFIKKDGSGLAATLFAIKKQEKGKTRSIGYPMLYRRPHYDFPEGLDLNKITKYVNLANASIQKIDVENSPFDNLLSVRVTINGANHNCTLPLAALSDGTIKWIVFVTLLFSKRAIFSIEEPENYLHPSMQSELISLMRNIGGRTGQILMTTHSETILNSLKPDEIQIVSFVDGGTKVKWLENPKEISKEIADTGFGLGYFYISGGVE